MSDASDDSIHSQILEQLHAAQLLQQPVRWVKLSTKGDFDKRMVQISHDCRRLQWFKEGSTPSLKSSISLDDVIQISVDKSPPFVTKTLGRLNRQFALTLVTSQRTLTLYTADEELLDQWAKGLEVVHHKISNVQIALRADVPERTQQVELSQVAPCSTEVGVNASCEVSTPTSTLRVHGRIGQLVQVALTMPPESELLESELTELASLCQTIPPLQAVQDGVCVGFAALIAHCSAESTLVWLLNALYYLISHADEGPAAAELMVAHGIVLKVTRTLSTSRAQPPSRCSFLRTTVERGRGHWPPGLHACFSHWQSKFAQKCYRL